MSDSFKDGGWFEPDKEPKTSGTYNSPTGVKAPDDGEVNDQKLSHSVGKVPPQKAFDN